MSTRSGKRIHNSVHENTEKLDIDTALKTERKTRSKRMKENDDTDAIAPVSKSKKRQNYVSYPADDDAVETAPSDVTEENSRKRKRQTLKEQNLNVESENLNSTLDKKDVRVTRQTRKVDNDDKQTTESTTEGAINGKTKSKKNKKKKSKDNTPEVNNKTKKSKKKKGKRSKNSFESKEVLDSSHVSSDAFHSAAGSPIQDDVSESKSKKSNSTLEKTLIEEITQADTTLKNENKRRKSSNKTPLEEIEKASDELNTTYDKLDEEISSDDHEKEREYKTRKSLRTNNAQTDKNTEANTLNGKKNKGHKKTKSVDATDKSESILNTTFDKNVSNDDSAKNNYTQLNNTADKKKNKTKSLDTTLDKSEPKLNSTFDKNMSKNDSVTNSTDLNNTADKKLKNKKSDSKLNSTFDKSITKDDSLKNNGTSLNNTFDKKQNKETNKTVSLDSTFDKTDTKLNSTFDKKDESGKSSLISSDNTINITYDKDNSRVSITSDESKTENIVNTTPLLIESSMDESNVSTKKSIENIEISDDNDTSITPTKETIAPLKREGTFTKESPTVKPKVSLERTPSKRISLPSPGLTPFHPTRSSQKSVLNVTRSIEKPLRRSSLAELVPRQTKVMFCSPVNNPIIASQQKKKVIKSSLKGSNKSFVFEDSEAPRPSARKRSFTHNDVEESRAKRKRLCDELQQSVDRLSRPRTSSVSAKPDSTPSKKAPTPSKPRVENKRTKLPNFAALHQKNFDKMESLDECQMRKRKRAKQLMTPTGSVTVLDRSSPKTVPEQSKPKNTPKKADISSKETKLPTLDSLRPGYTRFGFKMDSDCNPFSVPAKKEEKKEKPNGMKTRATLPTKNTTNTSMLPTLPAKNTTNTSMLPILPAKTTNNTSMLPALQTKTPLTRQATLPSLNGTTRKEAAKQTVMREKSFTSLSSKRNVKRSESRTIIKGVRTNRRFELQMKMRNVD